VCIGDACRRASSRIDPHTWPANTFEPEPNFVFTLSPPPYDADQPPAYTILASDDTGAGASYVPANDAKPSADDSLPAYTILPTDDTGTGTANYVLANDVQPPADDALPAYDNRAFTADED